jgi:hypothetical protein
MVKPNGTVAILHLGLSRETETYRSIVQRVRRIATPSSAASMSHTENSFASTGSI